MNSILRRTSRVLCGLVWLLTAAPVAAADDGERAPDVGVVHAAGDEAWVDVPAGLAETWAATLAELKERGHISSEELSYVESNGQIALDSLWIAVVPGASLDVPVTRVRIVILVDASEAEAHTAALVGAGAVLGSIVERLPAPAPAPVGVPLPATTPADALPYAEPAQDPTVYNTYNTYNTYTTYDEPEPVYIESYYPTYYPSVVYVWKPWWWLGWCHNGWSLGWNWYGPYSSWGVGWGWNSFCHSWWNWPGSCSSWDNDPWWWDCDSSSSFVATNSFPHANLRQRLSLAQQPNLSFSSRGRGGAVDSLADTSGRGGGRSTSDRGDRGSDSTFTIENRSSSGRGSSSGSFAHSGSGAGRPTIAAFQPRESPTSNRGVTVRHVSSLPSRSSESPRSIVVTRHSTSGTRAQPGSVTKIKGFTLTTSLGAIHDASSLARSTGTPSAASQVPSAAPAPWSSSSHGFSGASVAAPPSSPFTIGAGNSGRGPETSSSSSSSHSSSQRASSATPIWSGPSHLSKPSAPVSAPRLSSPAPRSSGASSGHSSSMGSSSKGGGSSMGGGGGSGGGSSSMGGGGGRSSGGKGR